MKLFLPTLATASFLFTSVAMAAPITYGITTAHTYFGTISGTITGEGSTLESYNITATSGPSTYIFADLTAAQLNAGAFATAFPYYGYTDGSGGPISEFYIENDDPASSALATLSFFVTGDFESGLTYIGSAPTFNADGTPYLNGGQPGSATGPAAVQDASFSTVALDDLLLTRVDAVDVPEPSSALILLATLGVMVSGQRGRSTRRG